MLWLLKAFLLISLLLVCWQDFRQRQIHLLTIVALTATALAYNLNQGLFSWFDVGANLLFIFILLALVFMLFSLRAGVNIRQLFSNYLGLGDLLYWLAIITLFSFLSFAIYLSLSFIFSAIVHLVYLAMSNKPQKFIPLAGYQAIFLIIGFVLFEEVLKLPLYNFVVYIPYFQ